LKGQSQQYRFYADYFDFLKEYFKVLGPYEQTLSHAILSASINIDALFFSYLQGSSYFY
jgi:hypothetical protein